MDGAHGSTVNSKMLWSIEGKRNHQLKRKQKPSLGGWAFAFPCGSVYGLTVWMEWLPCGTAASAEGLSPTG